MLVILVMFINIILLYYSIAKLAKPLAKFSKSFFDTHFLTISKWPWTTKKMSLQIDNLRPRVNRILIVVFAHGPANFKGC